jgi:hypothetical protein
MSRISTPRGRAPRGRRYLVGGLMACIISGVAFAQAPPVPAMPKEYQEMAAAMAAAQAKAVRPGDEALGCAAIDKELTQLQAVAPGRGAASQHALAHALAAQPPKQTPSTPQQAQIMQAAAAQQAAAIQQAMIAQRNMTPQQVQAMQQALAAQGMTPQQIQAMQTLALQQSQALSTPQAQAALQAQALAAQQALANPQVQAALQAQTQALANPQLQAALQAQAQALANPKTRAALAAPNAQLAQLDDPSAELAMMTTVMPQLLRSQRLIGLAMAKGCQSLGAAAPVVPTKK